MRTKTPALPWPFIWRRIQSLAGLWLVIFIVEHLLTNSTAALYFGDDGKWFITLVNHLHDLPYLQVVEVAVLGLPFLLHALWGIQYALTAKHNNCSYSKKKPAMGKYVRNHGYTLQRITAWILLVGVILHVFQMRFYDKPIAVEHGDTAYYAVRVGFDPGLYTLAPRLGVFLYDSAMVKQEQKRAESQRAVSDEWKGGTQFDLLAQKSAVEEQEVAELRQWADALAARPINAAQVIAVAPTFGTALLLRVRDVFKSPLMMILYTLFVLSAVFHAFNGLWTFLISWGVILTARTQDWAIWSCRGLMVLFALLGLVTIWCTSWINLYR
ncbi:succinate dehydrogenase [Simkania negevensis]|uniref:Succinate dehydrogenase n=1 Tax=Simkania negevensis TaxID=83561 RepID=A0ABS3AVA0_9BACT|nr:succinate dehydrogenase [Simkania negevensis]